jgi:hypothetical protein
MLSLGAGTGFFEELAFRIRDRRVGGRMTVENCE